MTAAFGIATSSRGEDETDPRAVELAVSAVLEADTAVKGAAAEVNRRLAAMPAHLVRQARAMIGFQFVGEKLVPRFASSADEINVMMDRWGVALRTANASENELRSADLIRGLLLADLDEDARRIAAASTSAGVPEAVGRHNEALAAQDAATKALNHVRPRSVADASALATFLAIEAYDPANAATYGAVAVSLQRCLAEISTGKPQRPLLDS